MNPFEQAAFLDSVHRYIPIDTNLDILFAGCTVAGHDFLPLYREAISVTKTEVGQWKQFRRAQRAFTLAKYFESNLATDGAWIECGVLRGFSARLLATIARLRFPEFTGHRLHLVDSFEGLSQPTREDAIGARKKAGGGQELIFSNPAGHFATPVEHVRGALAEFPDIQTHRGWIPEALKALPEKQWSFVHIDVDLYEPTLGALEYFVPRMVPGGLIINDDFGSPLFPGAGAAWAQFFARTSSGYVVLDTGQAIYRNAVALT